jgi:hypothetical protein
MFDKKEETRDVALSAFRRWAPDLAEFLPTLIHEIDSSNSIRRRTASQVLKALGIHAETIITALMTTSGNTETREVISALMEQPVPSEEPA